MALAAAWPYMHSDVNRDLDGCFVMSADSSLVDKCIVAGLKVVVFHDMIDNIHSDAGFASLINTVMRVRNGGFIWVSLHWSGALVNVLDDDVLLDLVLSDRLVCLDPKMTSSLRAHSTRKFVYAIEHV